MKYFWLSYVTLMGLIIGSFLNVCIYRIPLHLNAAKGRSFCPHCKRTLAPYDMVPVVSYFLLRGKCRFCKAPISIQYPIVELATGISFLLAFLQYGFTIYSGLLCLFFCVLLVIAVIDYQLQIIPDLLNLILLGLGIASMLVRGDLVSHLIGFAAISVPMLLLALITNGFGGGDIKFAAVCGLFLTWQPVILGTLTGCILGAIYGAVLLIRKQAKAHTAIPFGPFLAAGYLFAALYGQPVIDWYLHLFAL